MDIRAGRVAGGAAGGVAIPVAVPVGSSYLSNNKVAGSLGDPHLRLYINKQGHSPAPYIDSSSLYISII